MVNDTTNYDFATVLRRYGYFGFNTTDSIVLNNSRVLITKALLEPSFDLDNKTLKILLLEDALPAANVDLDICREEKGQFLYKSKRYWFSAKIKTYRPLLNFISFSSSSVTPLLVTSAGRTVVGWWLHQGQRYLVIGLRVVDEMVRYTQGNPDKVFTAKDKTLWGYGHERATYLFEDNITDGHDIVPWADRLGFFLANIIAEASGLPLIEPLPRGAKGAILLTGDDDQAILEKYDEQLRLLDGFPITYLMLPHTNHTKETLNEMPSSVEFGVHIDALPDPDSYNSICKSQTDAVRDMLNQSLATVRNHGHLNQGYWGHLSAWENCDLGFDLNIRGLDGTCPTGSYLPFRVRRPDGIWSTHVSLFSTFSDSMYYMQKWTKRKQIKSIKKLARMINNSIPGVIVMNLHPQNVSDFHEVHKTVMAIGRQSGWVALGAQSYFEWLKKIDTIQLVAIGEKIQLQSSLFIDGLAYSWVSGEKKSSQVLPKWTETITLEENPF